jgi:hypothetical protein
MSEKVRMTATALAATYDFPATGVVVDIGGGKGTLLSAVLRTHPNLSGMLFDQPQVVAGATATLEQAGVSERCQVDGGDFFVAVPGGGTLYILSEVIHDWDDERSVAILRRCAEAMPSEAKILLVEHVIEAGNAPAWAKFLDLQMLVMTGGRERAAEEFERLFQAAGLRLTRIIPMEGDDSLIEGKRLVEV